MKKFFKALALVLALTLVIGVMPASAADDVKVNKAKTLYVGGTQGSKLDADGNVVMSKYAAKVAVRKLTNIAKADAADHEISAVIENEEIAHLSPKGNYIVADAIGTTNVTVTVDGVDYAVVLTVKKSASAETLTITGLEKDAEYVVGETIDVTLPRAGKDTDVRALSVKGADGVELAVAGEKARTWTVTFPAVGAYTVAYCAFQSEKFNNPTAADTFDVTVKMPEIVSTRQISASAFEVKFASKVEGFVSTVGDVYYEVGSDATKVTLGVVKNVVPKEDVVTVTMYNSFTANTTYKCEVAGQVAEFTAKSFSKNDIAKIELAVENPVEKTDAVISYKLLTADGIDITDVLTTVKPVFATTSENAWLTTNSDGKDCIYFYEAGRTATITAVIALDWVEKDGVYTQNKIEATPLTVTSISPADVTLVKKQYSFNDNAADEKHTIVIGEDGTLAVNYFYSNAADKAVNVMDTLITKIEIADETKAMVVGGKIKGLNEGSTTVIAYKTNSDGSYAVVDAFPLQVTAKAVASKATIELTQNTLNIASDVVDTANVKVAVKDQYDRAAADYDVTIEQVANNKEYTKLTLVAAATTAGLADGVVIPVSATGAADDVKTAKNVAFVVTVKNKAGVVLATQTLNLSVMDTKIADVKPNAYKLVASETTLDIAAVYDTTKTPGTQADVTKSSTVTLHKYYNGFNMGVVTDVVTQAAENIGTAVPVTGSSAKTYIFYVAPKNADGTPATNFNGTTLTVKNIDGSAAATVGTYNFYAFYCDYADATNGYKLITKENRGTATITVVDTTVKPTITLVDGTAAKVLNADGSIKADCIESFDVTWAGKTFKATDFAANSISVVIKNAVKDTSTNNVFVETVTVTVPAATYGTKSYDLTVSKLFK